MDNNTIVNINEVTQTTTETSNKIGIFITRLILYKYAYITVHFYNSNGGVIRVEHLKLEGEDYSNWASDDTYVETYVLNKLNLTPAQTIEIVNDTNLVPDQTTEPVNDTNLVSDQTTDNVNDTNLVPDQTTEPVNDTNLVPDQTTNNVNDTNLVSDQTTDNVNDTNLVPDQTTEPVNDTNLATPL